MQLQDTSIHVYLHARKKYLFVKRLFDIFISILMLLMLWPLFVVIALVVRIDSPGPVLYTQERIGKDGRPFLVFKFRTMVQDAEKNGPQWAEKGDQRITRIGYYLRKYRLDELPQLLNVVKGEMSLIGPRPERLVFIERFEKEIPTFRERLCVRPGITGWAQVHGGYELTPKEKLELDLYYIQHCSFLLDLKILLKSIPVVIFAKGWR
ncbi:exopolysaccharide biosynthesis polyprenyl glycosylphosphotransferase [Anoxybacillus tengchongensis]|uniref:Exopolysaccharide biosynthesis polyprenyl glycosylphosphotransferase n=1 Tax=Anoxybacillus tengchongensis TaxID=576944 RepID=A0A7X0DAF7_9BACL|nr:exopolysaccharide biosynthesis polyprenyl glycosylphosphotransferase [Anoxybacillus tengchongensis]MBB6176074.1 exopolysaccharide biosynthesis polyprenyl glycosylphosphotransferase [Anoxybacillus tengchongensis]